MPLGEKLFEETGMVTSFRITKVNPVEGTEIDISFMSELKGIGKVPSGKNSGSGTMTQFPHGSVNASYRGFLTTQDGELFMWWANEKSRIGKDGKVKGLVIVSGFTNSQKLSWMNNLVMVLENEFDPSTQQFKTSGFEWKVADTR